MSTQVSLYRQVADHDFYGPLMRLAAPIAAQQLVVNALNAVDVLMVGQLGETVVAGVGLANQIFFLLSLFLFGVGSGAAVFSAQFWGRRDIQNLRRVLGLGLILAVGGGTFFALAAICFPQQVLSLYSHDRAVIDAGSLYLQIVGICYVPTSITAIYGMVLRSTRQVRAPVTVSVVALCFKAMLAYGLIFGRFGLPEMGVLGAALANMVARCVECVALLTWTYRLRLPAAARLGEMLDVSSELWGRFVRTAGPVVLGELLWSFGTTTYNGIFARLGAESMAAVSISGSIEGIAAAPFLSLANVCAIMLGNRLGAGDVADAQRDAWRFLRLAIGGAVVTGVVMATLSSVLPTLYQISPGTRAAARSLLLIVAGFLWVKASNMLMIVGILRSGGDTRFAFFADTLPLWAVGLPAAFLAAFVFHLPVYGVMMMVMVDELTRFGLSLWRVISRQWINNLIHAL